MQMDVNVKKQFQILIWEQAASAFEVIAQILK